MSKQRFRTMIIVLAMALFASCAYAGHTDSHIIWLAYITNGSYDRDPDERSRPNRGNRLPSKPMEGVISHSDGVEISGVETEGISVFEIYDKNGMLMASYLDEHDFVDYLFTLHGEFELCFRSSDFYLTGCIEL